MILMYHNIEEDAGFNTVAKKNFNDQIRYLLDNGFSVVSFDEYIELILTDQLTKRSVTITFDDAYTSAVEIVYPMFNEYKIPFTLFVPTGKIDQFNDWDSLITPKKIMITNWKNLKELSKNSILTIGSHGVSHKCLKSLSPDEILFEISNSKTTLEQQLDTAIRFFSYPYGQYYKHFNNAVIQTLKDNNYIAACSTNWNRFNSKNDLYRLNRIEIEPIDNLQLFAKKINLNYHPKYYRQQLKNVLAKIYSN